MNRQKRYEKNEYDEILAQKGCHTYKKKRNIIHLSKICTLENLLYSCSPDKIPSEIRKETEKIIQTEKKKLWKL